MSKTPDPDPTWLDTPRPDIDVDTYREFSSPISMILSSSPSKEELINSQYNELYNELYNAKKALSNARWEYEKVKCEYTYILKTGTIEMDKQMHLVEFERKTRQLTELQNIVNELSTRRRSPVLFGDARDTTHVISPGSFDGQLIFLDDISI